MDLVFELQLIGRMILAAILGFIIGLERAFTGHPAGERTHALAAVGAATFTVISLNAFPGWDPTRIVAGLVTGLGFLGAGMILKAEKKEEVHGLTTAAGIWAVGAIGMAVGAEMYVFGIGTTILIGFILVSEMLLKIDQRFEQWNVKKKRLKNHEHY